jgi:hypothetical protein
LIRLAKLSSIERLRSTFTLPAKLLPVQRSPRSPQTSQHVMTPRPAELQPKDEKQQQRRQQPLPPTTSRETDRPGTTTA